MSGIDHTAAPHRTSGTSATRLAGALRVDVHMHIYQSKAEGQMRKDAFEVVEYGVRKDVTFSKRAGDVSDALEAMTEAAFSYAVVLNLFRTTPSDQSPPASRRRPNGEGEHPDDSVSPRERLTAYNRWLCEICRAHRQFIPFISLNPLAMSPEEMVSHLQDMISHFGARGVKLHPSAQGFAADDQRMWPVYRTCGILGVPVLAHAGVSTDRGSEPKTFSRVMSEFPNLKLILAHLGGGAWRQTRELAEAHQSVHFDCSEIIAWTGARVAPSDRELAKLIRDIGSSRVLLGTDFPWYDLDLTAAQLLALPILADEEKEGILGQNAARLLDLPNAAPID